MAATRRQKNAGWRGLRRRLGLPHRRWRAKHETCAKPQRGLRTLNGPCGSWGPPRGMSPVSIRDTTNPANVRRRLSVMRLASEQPPARTHARNARKRNTNAKRPPALPPDRARWALDHSAQARLQPGWVVSSYRCPRPRWSQSGSTFPPSVVLRSALSLSVPSTALECPGTVLLGDPQPESPIMQVGPDPKLSAEAPATRLPLIPNRTPSTSVAYLLYP